MNFDHNHKNVFKNICYLSLFIIHNKSKQETKEEAIVRLYKADDSIGAIRRITGARLDRVEYTINYYKQNEQVPAPRCSNRPPNGYDK